MNRRRWSLSLDISADLLLVFYSGVSCGPRSASAIVYRFRRARYVMAHTHTHRQTDGPHRLHHPTPAYSHTHTHTHTDVVTASPLRSWTQLASNVSAHLPPSLPLDICPLARVRVRECVNDSELIYRAFCTNLQDGSKNQPA